MAAAAMSATGCSTQPSHTPAAVRASSSATPSPPAVPALAGACEPVQTVMLSFRAAASHWSVEQHPFDRGMSRTIDRYAIELGTKTGTAATPVAVRSTVTGTARAFHEVSAAMRSRDRRKLTAAIRRSQRSYAHLKQVCSLE